MFICYEFGGGGWWDFRGECKQNGFKGVGNNTIKTVQCCHDRIYFFLGGGRGGGGLSKTFRIKSLVRVKISDEERGH